MSDKPERIYTDGKRAGNYTSRPTVDREPYIRADLYEAKQGEVEGLQRTAEDRGVELERQKQKNRTLLKLMKEDGRDGNLEVEVAHLRKDNTEWQRKHGALRQMYKQARRGKREAERDLDKVRGKVERLEREKKDILLTSDKAQAELERELNAKRHVADERDEAVRYVTAATRETLEALPCYGVHHGHATDCFDRKPTVFCPRCAKLREARGE